MTDIRAFLERKKALIDSVLAANLPQPEPGADRVLEAMRYAIFSDGKRLRPALMLEVAEMLGLKDADILEAASAMEFVHTCSLILDDLPSMDNSQTRRGKPALHVAFDEATAVLAAEGLLLHAFRLIASNARRLGLGPEPTAEAVTAVADASGYHGMVSGQYLDLQSKLSTLTREAVESIHYKKTAALFVASARLAAILCGASKEQEKALCEYASSMGLAFQITDDLLDAQVATAGESSEELNYAILFGIQAARDRAAKLVGEALKALRPFGDSARLLADLARYVLERGK